MVELHGNSLQLVLVPCRSYYCEASTCDNCWFAVAGEVTATLGKEGRALKTENADLAGMVMKFTFVLSGQKIWGDALLKEREGCYEAY